MSRILLAGGGTAGHVNPLLALADVLKVSGHATFALGTSEGIESRLVPNSGIDFFTIPKLPFPRRTSRHILCFPFKFFSSVKLVRSILIEHKIQVVVGFGGYVAAPAYAAAISLNIPYVVHESNARPGLANLLAAHFAKCVGISVIGALPCGKLVGTPIRRDLTAAASFDPVLAKEKLGLDPVRKLLLVFGGSQGSAKINMHMRAALPRVLKLCDEKNYLWQVLHITGYGNSIDVNMPHYSSVRYMDSMGYALSAADLVVSRAGSSTVAELCTFGIPAIYIPYPFGNGEQRRNVSHMESAARIIQENDLSQIRLEDELLELMTDDERREAMSIAAKRFAICNAAQNTASLIELALSS
ncbi:UDP-N-acetylglucosamine--N-acetylmuramyl-(pentapeptide) pyrophosphoryl-undecaprenol N-acetylglucosamine transferase [Tropheryma whipplei]|uniref:UDP-N-acetylglucosamine--N-acetylmuramyl- (pentapeptide) pyrophosphoryl-undecaprenol N-acetylglucosamine transferase n=1 Tax=Tropheryma whipplei TaxID=2039 RepID=UPI0004BB310C|nr:UDP-N-acetylglucosamine--N-acetylmuramyl-(pentapeptide) pyrophosphoryl-undecaprenol N-acetylglucosamine transferase [Tropheryma whipplei]